MQYHNNKTFTTFTQSTILLLTSCFYIWMNIFQIPLRIPSCKICKIGRSNNNLSYTNLFGDLYNPFCTLNIRYSKKLQSRSLRYTPIISTSKKHNTIHILHNLSHVSICTLIQIQINKFCTLHILITFNISINRGNYNIIITM